MKIIKFIFENLMGPIIGLIGLGYGYIKDREIKNIKRRAQAPYFEFDTFELDSESRNAPIYDQPWYNYRQQPSSLDEHLIGIEEIKAIIPENYPDGLVIGISLINRGTQIRTISIKSKENVFFRDYRNNVYSLRYYFKREEIGKKLIFSLKFETIDGVQQKQKWLYIKGEQQIKRTKPKTVDA